MDWNKLIDWIKLSPKYLLPISLVSGTLILAPTSLLVKFGLDAFVTLVRPWIGIIFLLATSLLIVNILYSIYDRLRSEYDKQKNRKYRLERLLNLTTQEKEIFLGYIIGNTRTQYFSCSNGVVGGLESEGFIFKSSNVGHLWSWPFNIKPWVWNLLKDNTDLYFSKEDISSYLGQKSKDK